MLEASFKIAGFERNFECGSNPTLSSCTSQNYLERPTRLNAAFDIMEPAVSTQAVEIAQIFRTARCPSGWFGQSALRSVTRVIEFEQRGHTGGTQ